MNGLNRKESLPLFLKAVYLKIGLLTILSMTKQSIFKIVVFGLVQWILLLVIIFTISLIYGVKEGAEMTAPPALGMAIVVVILAVISYLFGHWLKPANRKQVIIAGLIWSGMTTVIMLVTLVGNKTQDVFLNSWVAYLIFIAQVVGTMFVSVKKTGADNPSPTV